MPQGRLWLPQYLPKSLERGRVGYPNPNLFHLLLQGVQGVSPRQQLLQAPQLPLLLLAVLLLLLPFLLQRRDLGFIAADGVWQGRKGRGEGESVHQPYLGANRELSITVALCKAIYHSGDDSRFPGWTEEMATHSSICA